MRTVDKREKERKKERIQTGSLFPLFVVVVLYAFLSLSLSVLTQVDASNSKEE